MRATDSASQITEALFQIDIIDDDEAPYVSMVEPSTAITVLPGESFKVAGAANDNIYIDSIQAVLTDANGVETPLEWLA